MSKSAFAQKTTMSYQIIVHPCTETNGYWAECPQLQGCNTSGITLGEVRAHMHEAVALCLEDCTGHAEGFTLEFEVLDA